jgi:TrmH family RNA methyltransferase
MERKPKAAPHRILTLARDLQRRKARERASAFVAEGARVVGETLRAGVPLRGALVTADAADRHADLVAALRTRGVECVTVTDAEFESAADTDRPQGVLCIADVPDVALASLPPAALTRVLVLDAIQDPGNVGTLIRTAAALGAGTVVALPGTADPWSAKVVRGAAGGHFHVHVTVATLPELLAALGGAGVPLWAADAGGRPVRSLPAPDALALAVGNEGAGITPAVRGAAAEVVSLPMAPGVESLNVGVAAGILLYALAP